MFTLLYIFQKTINLWITVLCAVLMGGWGHIKIFATRKIDTFSSPGGGGGRLRKRK